jgi:uncharacterized protein YjbI with pentapeptide repeats
VNCKFEDCQLTDCKFTKFNVNDNVNDLPRNSFKNCIISNCKLSKNDFRKWYNLVISINIWY